MSSEVHLTSGRLYSSLSEVYNLHSGEVRTGISPDERSPTEVFMQAEGPSAPNVLSEKAKEICDIAFGGLHSQQKAKRSRTQVKANEIAMSPLAE